MYIHTPPHFSINEFLPTLEAGKLVAVTPTNEQGQYLHWDELRHRPPPKHYKDPNEYWQYLKMARFSKSVLLPFEDTEQRTFLYCSAALEPLVFMFDRLAAGSIGIAKADDLTRPSAEHYLVSGLMDEAIHSSQLEGASTTYAQAKTMLRENRQPIGKDKRMIFNNYRAMRDINEKFIHKPLTMNMLLELHSVLTDGTLDSPKDQGRVRNSDEDDADGFGVYYNDKLIHQPPPWQALDSRLQKLFDFANAPPEKQLPFIHPACRAMILHFMLAYYHPFIDGNGRIARALFYWAMARNGYWLTAYAPISAIIQQSARKYVRSFLYSEKDTGIISQNTDTADLTYFLLYHTRLALAALERLGRHVKTRQRELRRTENQLQRFGGCNARQMALVRNALRHPNAEYVSDIHAHIHTISKPTAIADLNKLVAAGLLQKRQRGKRFVYTPVGNLRARLKD